MAKKVRTIIKGEPTVADLMRMLKQQKKQLDETSLLLHQYATAYARLNAAMRIMAGEKGSTKLEGMREVKFLAKYAMDYAKDQKGFAN